jgi:TolB-like protein/Tfp pilus assembly protein PilF
VDKPFAAYKGDDPYVFVCYGHEDAAEVYPELAQLHASGVNIWYDEGIPPGTNWRAEIGGALDGAAMVLFYVSKASIASDHCNREINYALDEGKQIVPVLLDDAPLPADLKMGLSRVQMIHKAELSEQAYMSVLQSALGSAGDEPQPAVPQAVGQQQSTGQWLRWVAILVAVAAVGIYQFTQQDGSEPTGESMQSEPTAADGSEEPSIAVLPFVNMSSDPEQEFFSDGISEELLNLLAKNPKLKVISRSSSFVFKDRDVDIPTVAERLGVDHVLEGSVRKAGNKVRITAQLIDTVTDTHLWSETYDRELDDIFAIQDEIAGQVVDALQATLLGDQKSERDVDIEAYTLYLQGRHLVQEADTESLLAAEQMLRKSIAIDPNHADAWVQLVPLYSLMRDASLVPAETANQQIEQAIARAMMIDPENAGAHAASAFYTMAVKRDLASAIESLESAASLEPNNLIMLSAASTLELNLGRLENAEAFSRRETELDPLCANCFARLGNVYMLQGKYERARQAFETVELIGGVGADFNLVYGLILLMEGNYEAGMAKFAKANPGPFRTYAEVIGLYSLGRETEFAERFAQMQDQYGADYPTMVARVHAWMGDADSAFEWLEKYQIEHPELGPVIGNFWELLSVEFKPLHDDPRWLQHLRRLGIAPEQLAVFEFDIPLPD